VNQNLLALYLSTSAFKENVASKAVNKCGKCQYSNLCVVNAGISVV